ncbi:MAG: lysine 2,3-aminomutase [Hydrogenophilales bacterium CG_4_10_14_3_um_filter_63_21]|nr:MAG: lysine 2,3-aminomutase [Hydrogenophilales bacterium CG_4_10_14_3_um_filter_63_21]
MFINAVELKWSNPVQETQKYKAYSLNNFRDIPQMAAVSEALKFDIEVVGHVLPFKTNNFVVDHLIDWENVPLDPLFVLTFPQRDMLLPHHYDEIAGLIRAGADSAAIKTAANRIRLQLNPHPAGQVSHNIPSLEGEQLDGMQHKYRETVLFFPSQGQTCHAYCSFCFRWPQFVGLSDLKFASREVDRLIAYLQANPQVTDVLFTGGDPLIMSARNLALYIEPLLEADLPNLRRIRIGSKALSFWPYRFLGGNDIEDDSDNDSEDLLALFRKVSESGKHLAFMAHFNHPRELAPEPVQRAILRIRQTGAVIRTQSPLLRHINDEPAVWIEMWNRQVDLGCIPYYMFIARDTGAQHFFSVPLVRAWEIFREAYQHVGGLCRTVRGPSMSANPGKVQVLGVSEVNGEKVIQLRFIQGRNPDWVHRPFLARYDESATWLSELKPAFGEAHFFFQDELEQFYRENLSTGHPEDYE